MSTDISSVKEDVKEVKDDLKANTEITRKGFDTMNGRLKDMELWRARQEERQSLTKGANIDWESIIKLALKALGASIVLATGLVALLQTLIGSG